MLNINIGLKNEEVIKLQAKYGFNELPIEDRKSFLKILIQIITEPMFSLLLLAALIYLIIGSLEDALLLTSFIALSIVLTTFQEHKSEKAIEALKDLSSPRALVIRDGIKIRIPGRDLVPGDLMVLEEGDRIAADSKLIRSHDLLVDESLLTGESEPIEKKVTHSIYSGSMVVRGGGQAIVEKIGLQTEIGKIGKSLHQIDDYKSPLQSDIKVLIKRFAFFGISLSLLICLIYGLIYKNWLEGALSGISLTMALLPEEFTIILTVFMALGVWRISRHHVLTRKASVIETLGSINTLCVDKTGTLTLNKMSLNFLVPLDAGNNFSFTSNLSPEQKEILNYAVLASEIEPFDPMDKAFHESIKVLNCEHQKLFQDYSLIHEYGLNPKLPVVAHAWQLTDTDECLIALKGSPEAVMSLCQLKPDQKAIIELQIKSMASQGVRLLGVAKARHIKNSSFWPDSVHSFDFEWVGLAGLKDPLRPEVVASVKQCRDAGIRIIMITGDHAITAKAIALQAGIEANKIVSGIEIDLLSNQELQEIVKEVCVFVRIKPDQKLRLVKALQSNHEIVAMTGDGINDAPALKAAHVGISMGQRGTDVAREASSLVLLNDDFSSIVKAIQQGRQIYDNLQKAIIYVVAIHIPIAGAVFIPLIIGEPPLLSPIHILFLEMIIDPSCAIVFEAEQAESNIMKRPPRNPNQKIFDLTNLSMAIIQGIGLMFIVMSLYVGLLNWGYSIEFATTISFGSLVLGNLFLVIVSRSQHTHIFNILKKVNSAQYWIIAITICSFLTFTLIPYLKERLRFSELTIEGGFIILFSSLLGLIWYETIKAVYHYRGVMV